MSTTPNPNTTAAIPPPMMTREQIQAMLAPKIRVYNPSDFRETPQIGGRYYTAEPTSEIEIKDHLEWQRIRTEDGRTVTALFDLKNPQFYNNRSYILNDSRFPPKVAMGALQVADEMCSEQHYGPKGFIVLVGDGYDEERKKQAREKWLGWYSEYARGVEQSWIAKVSMYRAGNPGAVPPRQPKSIRAVLGWLDRYDRGLIDRQKWICGVCSTEFEIEAELSEHVSRRHPAMQNTQEGAKSAAIANPTRDEQPQPQTDAPAPKSGKRK